MQFVDDLEYDETSKADTKRIRAFLKDYKKLCRLHGCLVLSDGEDTATRRQRVEVAPDRKLAEEKDPWGVVEKTKSRGWKL